MLKDLILIAEENPDEAQGLVGMLRQCGIASPVYVVLDGEDVLDYLRGEGFYGDRKHHPLPVVMLLDLAMPKKGALEVLAWMRTQPELDVQVIVVTEHMNLSRMNEAYRLGADSFLTKPLQEHEVRSLVHRLNKMQMAAQ